jgi:hypothetical protein
MMPEKPGAIEERVLRRVPVEIVAVGAALALGTVLLFDLTTGLVFFAGAVLSALGFAWLRQSLTRILTSGRKAALRSGVALYALRLVDCGAFFLILLYRRSSPSGPTPPSSSSCLSSRASGLLL